MDFEFMYEILVAVRIRLFYKMAVKVFLPHFAHRLDLCASCGAL